MNLRIVRHAESTANAEERWQGRAEFPLSQTGVRQAERLSARLEREGYTPTRIYTSPLSRALDTACIVAAGWDRAIEPWDDLVESDVGAFTGLTYAEVEERFPGVAERFGATRDLDLIEGAEPHVERTARAQRVVDRLIGDHGNADRVLVFTHGGILTHIVAQLLEMDRLWALDIRNTAVFEFVIDMDRWHEGGLARTNLNLWRIVRFNDASHLEEVRDAD